MSQRRERGRRPAAPRFAAAERARHPAPGTPPGPRGFPRALRSRRRAGASCRAAGRRSWRLPDRGAAVRRTS